MNSRCRSLNSAERSPMQSQTGAGRLVPAEQAAVTSSVVCANAVEANWTPDNAAAVKKPRADAMMIFMCDFPLAIRSDPQYAAVFRPGPVEGSPVASAPDAAP